MATTTVPQAKRNPGIEFRDGEIWVKMAEEDIFRTELTKDGKPTGVESLKFKRSYTDAELHSGKSFEVPGADGKVRGIFKSYQGTLQLESPQVQAAKQANNMKKNFIKILKERTLLVTEKKSTKDGVQTITKIKVKDRDVITLAMMQKWEKDGSLLIGHTYQGMLDADKDGKWLTQYLKVKATLGQPNEATLAQNLLELAQTAPGSIPEGLVEQAKAFLADVEAKAEAAKKAKLVKSAENLARAAAVVAVEPSEELTEQGID